MLAEKLTNAVIAELQSGETKSPQAWAGIRRRVHRAVAEQLAAEEARVDAEAPKQPGPSSPVPAGSLLTTHDIARLLQVNASTVSKWIDQGSLVAFKTPGGHRRVRQEDFEAFREKFGMPITGRAA